MFSGKTTPRRHSNQGTSAFQAKTYAISNTLKKHRIRGIQKQELCIFEAAI